MKIYVDEQKRYEDTKATGQCFTAVGAIGLIAIVLLDRTYKACRFRLGKQAYGFYRNGACFLDIFYHRNEVIYGAKRHFKKN